MAGSNALQTFHAYRKHHPRATLLASCAGFLTLLYLIAGSSTFSGSGNGPGTGLRFGRYDYPPPTSSQLKSSGLVKDGDKADHYYPAFGPRNLASAVARSEALWASNWKKRRDWVAGHGGYSNIMAFSDKEWKGWGNMWTLWDIFVPSFPCPWETERLGVMADGGKYVCGLPRIQQARGKDCVVYSFGVERESSFEAEILERTDCEIFMYDFSVESFGPQLQAMNESMQARAHFHKYGLGGKDELVDGNQFYTLKTIMKQNGHRWIDILKVDIEGSEFTVLPEVVEDFGDGRLPFGQLQLEIHAEKTARPYSTEDFATWWERLERAGMRAFMSELNYPSIHWLHNPSAMEMNFLNNCNGKAKCGTLLREP